MTSALTNPELSLAATMALKDISRDCTDSMKPYAEQVSAEHIALNIESIEFKAFFSRNKALKCLNLATFPVYFDTTTFFLTTYSYEGDLQHPEEPW